MRWEHLTVPDFQKAVEDCGRVAVVPVGVIEPHARHLPLGQDMLASHAICCRAAELEPAVVFPPYPWGINHEAGHLPGAIVLGRELVLGLLETVCDEIGRNGFTKIILFQGHGGNRHVLPLFVQSSTERQRTYSAYYVTCYPDVSDVIETKETGHACEWETSVSLHLFPDLVKTENVPPEPFTSLKRNEPLRRAGVYSPVDWYAMYPTMYVGDAGKASAEKGRICVERRAEAVAEAIRAVKEDGITQALVDDFLRARKKPISAHE